MEKKPKTGLNYQGSPHSIEATYYSIHPSYSHQRHLRAGSKPYVRQGTSGTLCGKLFFCCVLRAFHLRNLYSLTLCRFGIGLLLVIPPFAIPLTRCSGVEGVGYLFVQL